MTSFRHIRWTGGRLGTVALATGFSLATSTPGFADTSKECIDAHAAGQRFQKSRRLKDARSQYTECANEKCPDMVRKECIAMLKDVSGLIPTVVFAATDAKGEDLSEVKVEMDGALLVERLDGHAVEVEPGKHTFRFQCEDGRVTHKSVVIREGDRARTVSVKLRAAAPKAKAKATGGKPAPAEAAPMTSSDAAADESAGKSQETREAVAYVLGVVGIMALGGFVYGTLSGSSHLSELEDDCAPNCTDGDVDISKQEYLLADISLAVAAVSLGAGAYLYFYVDPDSELAGSSPPPLAAGLRGITLGYAGRF